MADINQCPPGGHIGIARLAAHLGREEKPLNTAHGLERPRSVAFIEEAFCIGCTLCIQACPVDAIVGANKQLHTVIADQCTGCDLCVAPCPVDCIVMINVTGEKTGWDAWSQTQADQARLNFEKRHIRLKREEMENDARLAAKAATKLNAVLAENALTPEEQKENERKKAIITAAMERARLKKIQASGQNE